MYIRGGAKSDGAIGVVCVCKLRYCTVLGPSIELLSVRVFKCVQYLSCWSRPGLFLMLGGRYVGETCRIDRREVYMQVSLVSAYARNVRGKTCGELDFAVSLGR